VRGVKRNVTRNPAVSGETHFCLTVSTTIWGISTCSHPEETGRSGGVRSTRSCRGFELGGFKNGRIGELEETPRRNAGSWQRRPLPRGYVEAQPEPAPPHPIISRTAANGSLRLAVAQRSSGRTPLGWLRPAGGGGSAPSEAHSALR
jgi:hypothetical protein